MGFRAEAGTGTVWLPRREVAGVRIQHARGALPQLLSYMARQSQNPKPVQRVPDDGALSQMRAYLAEGATREGALTRFRKHYKGMVDWIV
ncbi:MAG: hypothetical protein ACYSWU_25945, partial [Planctomycetota bacterium]|jgi:hypothetical protein